MRTPDPGADVVDTALGGLHPDPVRVALSAALSRIDDLERKVAYLEQRVAVLVRMVDLLAEHDGA